jgi:crossover junction endodeoxyribonuclease RuvC
MAAGIEERHGGTKARRHGGLTSRILGIDPGLDRTGYAVIETSSRQGVRVIDAGIIRTDSQMPLAYRLGEIQQAMDEVLGEHGVALVAVEDLYAHYRHPRTAILMGHARGVILLAAARLTIPVLSLPATNIKKMLTGNGHAGKLQMQRAIVSTFRLRAMPEPPDVADAIAVAWCAGMCRRDS